MSATTPIAMRKRLTETETETEVVVQVSENPPSTLTNTKPTPTNSPPRKRQNVVGSLVNPSATTSTSSEQAEGETTRCPTPPTVHVGGKDLSSETFRIYASTGDEATMPRMERLYREQRRNQSLAYAKKCQEKYLTFSRPMTLWDAFKELDRCVDVSDPDSNLPNTNHLFQTAEGMRADGLPDWMQLAGLLHDLGKVLFLFDSREDGLTLDTQWGIVGDTYVLGCKVPDCLPYASQYNSLCKDPEAHGDIYGIYKPNCGLDNCVVTWGHDEYMYQVLKNHPTCTLPEPALYCVRFHSMYPHHKYRVYDHLLSDKDRELIPTLRQFQRYDLYTKEDVKVDYNELRPYYQGLIDKYIGDGVVMF